MSQLQKVIGGRWAISRQIGKEWVALIESTPVLDEYECTKVLTALRLPLATIDQFFPKNKDGQRCPTFELMERFFSLTSVQGPIIGV